MKRVVVLGAGRIGQIHAANVAASPLAELVSVTDPVTGAAETLGRKLNCEWHSDPYSQLSRPDVDAVIIGTPTDTHVPLTLAAIAAGKAVLCEKPLDLDEAKADRAVAEIERSGIPVMLGFNRRFDPSVTEIKRAIASGEIGDVRQIVITSRDPAPPPAEYISRSGGIFRDMLIHDFDMARWLLGEEPVDVFAVASCLVNSEIASLGDSDTTMVILKTASGRQAHINTCRQASYGHDQRVEVFGSKGMLLNDHMRAHTVQRFSDTASESKAPLLNFFLERYETAYRQELHAFLKALESGAPMPVTPRDASAALRLAECALKSVQTGRSISVARPN
jgi:myo-inositol 2-dehydrogenase/D-chiro-inositol 1-dehydrogenase